MDNHLRPQFSHALLERERDLKRISSATFDRCRGQRARSHAYRKGFKLGQCFAIGQKVLYKTFRQDLSRGQNLQQRRLVPFTVTKRVTNRTYQIQDDKDPTILKTVHRNHVVGYYLKEETLPPMIEEFVPMDRRHDDSNEIFMKQRIQKLNNFEQTSMEDSPPFPTEPSRTAPFTFPKKRVNNTSSDSGVNYPHVLSPAMPKTPDNSQRYLFQSNTVNFAKEYFNWAKNFNSTQFTNNSHKSENIEPEYSRSTVCASNSH